MSSMWEWMGQSYDQRTYTYTDNEEAEEKKINMKYEFLTAFQSK